MLHGKYLPPNFVFTGLPPHRTYGFAQGGFY